MPRIAVIGSNPAFAAGHTPVLPSTGTAVGISVVQLDPIQVVGLVPLISCNSTECREICEDGWKNPVFGKLESGSYDLTQSYENDWSTFLVDISNYNANPSAVTVTITLEKYFKGQWRGYPFGANLNNNNLGQLFDIASIPGHSSYTGYAINWGAVLFSLGEGCYRIKIDTSFTTSTATKPPTSTTYSGCLVSPSFDLKEFDCTRAHGTVKFETWITGQVGDPYQDYFKHNVCGFLWYDSLRTFGFIGYQKSPQYITNNLEWGEPKHGLIEKVSDEQIQRWEYNSKYLPEYIHTRFSTFAMMSDKLFASDYNLNNSDWALKRRHFLYDSGYEPEYIDREASWKRRNKSKVQVFFKRGVQSVIKSLCCPVR